MEFVVLLGVLLSLAGSAADVSAARVLVLSGQNNHAWEETTPALVEILRQAGGFEVETTDAPQNFDPARLKDFDAIVSNWNAWGPKGRPAAVADWPEALKGAYVDFVSGGGGHVAVHAGSSSFEGWEEYQRICGATWGLGQTNHGPPHEFEVRIDDAAHAVTKGLAGFKTIDELWNRPKVQPGFRVVASSFSASDRKGTGNWEPTALAGSFGRGRCYALLLGHDAGAMANPGFKELFLRGVAWAAAGKRAAAGGGGRPNVVVFLADDLGYGDVGVHGDERVKTPNIDAFARESVELAQFRVSPVCSPTRASLLTGRYSFRGGVCDVYGKACELDPAETTLAEALRASGYATGIFGKWHLGADDAHSPNAQGFDEALYVPGPGLPPKEYFDPGLKHNGAAEERKGYCMDVFAEAAIDFMRQNRDRPFLLYLPANLIHSPLVVSEELSKPFLEAGASDSTAKICGMIRSADAAFGRVRAALKELGVEENTLLIFASDNGPCSGSKPLDRHMAGLHGLKGTVYDNGIRVPCFARWPKGFASPARVERLTAHIDVMPTALEACGVTAPAGIAFDGRSLMPLLREAKPAWEDRALFFQWDSGPRPRRGSAFAVLTDRWKLVQPAGMDAASQQHIRDRYAELCRLQARGERSIEGAPRFELYAIADDPGETRDVASQHPEVVADLRQRYDAWFDDACSRWIPGGKAVPALHGWRPEQGLAPFTDAARAIQAVANDPSGREDVAKKLVALLEPSIPGAVRRFVCEQLAIVGGEGELPVLAGLLGDAALETPARGAIERIGGEAAAEALRAAYGKADGPARKAGLLGSLAKLRDAKAVPLAAAALRSEDPSLRHAALVALGRIGVEAAAEAILEAEGMFAGAQRSSWGSALLECAESLQDESAGRILERLGRSGEAAGLRSAATAARIRRAGEGGAKVVVAALKDRDPAVARGALDSLGDDGSAGLRAVHGEIAKVFDGIPPATQIGLLNAYAACDLRAGATLAATGIKSADPSVRASGFRTLGRLGGEADFEALFSGMASESEADRVAAGEGMAALRARSTDGRLIALLPSVPAKTMPLVIEVLGKRDARSALPALLGVARGEDVASARAALKAIGELGSIGMIPGLVDVLSTGGPAASSAGQLLARMVRAEPEAAKARLTAALPAASDSARETIGKILAIGDGAVAADLGPNLARGSKAESTTGLKRDGAAGGPDAAIDGNPETYWDEENGRAEYRLRITMKSESAVARLRITGYNQHAFAPKDFAVLCDGREAAKCSGAQYDDNRLLVEFPATRCRVVDLVITGYYGGSPAIRELEILGDGRKAGGGKPESAPAPMPRPAPARDEGISWDKSAGSVALLVGGKAVWRLHHGADEPFVFFDTLGLAGGENLVWKSPPDHKHHYAHWFSWKVINGVNYWEFDKTTGRPVGVTRCTDVNAETRADGSARVAMKLAYAPPEGKPVLLEERTLDVSAPAADGGYRIDWRMEWTAGAAAVVLDRTPPPGEPDGKAHGGYGGLSVRFAKDFSDWAVVDSEGVQGMEGHRKRAAASEFSGRSNGRECGMAILDHPKNPNAPTPWFYVITPQVPFGYTNPAFLCDSPKQIAAGGKLLLRYRVILHAGRWDPAALKRAVAAYAEEAP